jgi:hypothetical protein
MQNGQIKSACGKCNVTERQSIDVLLIACALAEIDAQSPTCRTACQTVAISRRQLVAVAQVAALACHCGATRAHHTATPTFAMVINPSTTAGAMIPVAIPKLEARAVETTPVATTKVPLLIFGI